MPISFKPLLIAALCAGLALSATSRADELLLEGIDAAAQAASERPQRGMSMDAVESRFGEPMTRMPAVGQPPITRWEYAEYIVYFEHNLVLHAALKRSRS